MRDPSLMPDDSWSWVVRGFWLAAGMAAFQVVTILILVWLYVMLSK